MVSRISISMIFCITISACILTLLNVIFIIGQDNNYIACTLCIYKPKLINICHTYFGNLGCKFDRLMPYV